MYAQPFALEEGDRTKKRVGSIGVVEIDAGAERSEALVTEIVSETVSGRLIRKIIRWPSVPFVLLGMILVLAAALDVFHLGAKSIWLDEAASIANARLDWPTLLKVLSLTQANMSLYYGLLHTWVGFGESEFTIRLPSALAAVAAVGAMYFLGQKLFSPRVGLIGALLLAVNAYLLVYAQTARSYSLLVLLVTVSSLAFIEAVERPAWKHWAVYIVAAVLSVYVHFFGFLVLLAHGASLAFFDRRRVSWKNVAVSTAIIGLCLLPLELFAVTRSTETLQTISSFGKPSRDAVIGLFYNLTGAGPTKAKPLRAAYGLACVIAIWAAHKRKTWKSTGFLLIWLGIPIALTLAVSAITPIFVSYYLIVCLPPLVLLVASGLSALRREVLTVALIVVLAMALYEDRQYYAQPAQEDWRAAITYVVNHAQPRDALFFCPAYLQEVYEYYRPPAGPPIAFPQHWSWTRAGYGDSMEGQSEAIAVTKALPHTYSRIWLFSRYGSVGPRIRLALADSYPNAQIQHFQGVGVTLYSGH